MSQVEGRASVNSHRDVKEHEKKMSMALAQSGSTERQPIQPFQEIFRELKSF